MTQRTIVHLEDDLDGGDADETVNFGLDGQAFEIDLSETNAEAIRKVLAAYVNAGRRASAVRSRAPIRPTGRIQGARTAPATNASTIREWALANGFTVGDRGRISADIRSAYESR